jgi:hypothetical protein
MAGELKDLDTNTLYTIIEYIDKRIQNERDISSKWRHIEPNQDQLRAYEDILKYVKYLHNMSIDYNPPSLFNIPLPFDGFLIHDFE